MFYPSIKAQLLGEIASYLFLDLSEQNDFIYMKRASTFDFYNAENDILVTIYGKNGQVPNAIFVEQINIERNEKELKKDALDTKFFELFTKNLQNIYGENIEKLEQTNVEHFYVELEQQFSEKKYLDNNNLLPSFRFCKDDENNIYIRATDSINGINLQPFIVTAFCVLVLIDNSTNNVLNLIDVILRKKSLKDLIKDKYASPANQITTNYYHVRPKQIKAFKLWELIRSKEDLKLFLVRGDEYEEFHRYVTDKSSIAYNITDTDSKTKFLVSNDIDFEEVCKKFDTVHEMDFFCGTELTYWIRSNKHTSLIYKDAIPCNDYVDPIKYENSIKVINGPAGCGKSFNLNKIMHEMQSVDKARWIESLYGSDLEKILCESSKADDTLNVLKKLFKITNSLEDDIFNFSLKIRGRLVLFVDDIDNINKKSTDQVLSFIKKLFFDYPTVLVWMSCSEGFGNIIVETIPIFPHTLAYEKDFIDSMLLQGDEAMTVNVIEQIHKQNSQAILKNPFNIDLVRQKIEKDGAEGSLYILDVYDFYIEQKILDFTNQTSVEELERSAAFLFFGTESGLDIDFEENLVFHKVFGKHKDRVIIEYLTAKYLLSHPTIVNNIMFQKEMTQVMNFYNRLQFRHTKFGSLVLNGKFEEILMLAEKESPVFVTDMLNRTLLYIVDDQYEHSGILDFLIEKGVPIDKSNNLTNDTIETYFDKKRAFKYIEILLRHGADWTKFNSILKCDSNELGSMFLNNCLEDNYKICELIIDQRKDFSVTPYHVFVATKLTSYDSHDFIIKTLRLAVKQGLSQQKPYIANYVGSACHNAARFCPRALEVMKILVEELNFDIHLTDCLGSKPISYADDIKLLKYLIEKGADPFLDKENINLTSRFHSACLSGNIDIVKYYMEELSPDMELLNQIPPLYFAVRSGSLELLKYLYEKGFTKVNEPYAFGEPPIYLACENGNFEIVKFLVEHGVDVNSTFHNKRPIDALQNGGKQNVLHIFNYLVDNGCTLKTNLLYILLKTLNYEAFKHYCEKLEVDWNYTNSDGHTLLHYATLKVHDKDILEYIATRSNLELPEDQNLATALHLAFSVKNVEAVDILIKLGANINAKSKNGLTMMHFAAKSPSKYLFQILFDRGLDINQKDNEGRSPIHNFVYYGRYDLASYLIKNGMHPNSQDNEGKTALHTICCSNRNCTLEGVECCLRDLKVNPHITDNAGRTALHYTIEKYSVEELLMIYSKYTQVDFDVVDASGDSLFSLSQKMDLKRAYKALCNIKSYQKYVD